MFYINFIIYIFIVLLNTSFSNCECSEREPFKRNGACESTPCTDNEISSGECYIDNYKIKIQWLNNILVFYDGINYRAGNFAINKGGDLIIEYSKENKRLLYGLKKDGSYYFNNTDYKNINSKIINIDNSITANRYESKNLFIYTNDENDSKEYLFSTGTYSVTELIDIENNKYQIFNTSLMMKDFFFSKAFSLLDLSKNSKKEYICIFTCNNGNNIKIFKFSFLNFGTYKQIFIKDIPYNSKTRILSSFIMDSYIVLIYLKNIGNNKNRYTLNIYDFNITDILIDLNVSEEITSFNPGVGIFFKSILLKEELIAFLYYTNNNGDNFKIKIGSINNNNFEIIFEEIINEYQFQANIVLNDLVKVNEERFILTTSSNNYQILYILLFDLYNNYKNMKIRIYEANLFKYKLKKELSTIIYNNFLIISSTVVPPEYEPHDPNDEAEIDNNCFSIFMIFGYVHSKEYIIDITEYFLYQDITDENNIVIKLIKNIIQ